MAKIRFTHADMQALFYFFITAAEKNMRAAAQRLFITEPPLSRSISKLEEKVGSRLFARTSRGLELTSAGEAVRDLLSPLMSQMSETFAELDKFAGAFARPLALGFTTAFDQLIFKKALLAFEREIKPRIIRKPSPQLARDVAKGDLDAAFVALPLQAPDLATRVLPYEEELWGALPEEWALEMGEIAELRKLEGKPLFWFGRRGNPAFYDHMQKVFAFAKFAPRFVDEPFEHDVLLAAIAAGEGFALMPRSFAVMSRPGIKYVRFAESPLMRIGLGYIDREDAPASAVREMLATLAWGDMRLFSSETC